MAITRDADKLIVAKEQRRFQAYRPPTGVVLGAVQAGGV
jgi:hypothetical protein